MLEIMSVFFSALVVFMRVRMIISLGTFFVVIEIITTNALA